MAMNNELNSPVNGTVNFTDNESGAVDDLEDGEIFDDDEPAEVFKGGGFEEKPPTIETPPKEPLFKNKGNSGGGERKKGQKDKDKRSNSNERRGDKRSDRGNNRNNASNKRKRGRESEDDHRTPNKPQKQRKMNEKNKANTALEEEVDENEMVYVMGGNSPTASKQTQDWEAFTDDEDQDRERDNDRGNGGGRGGRRGREGFHSSGRMSRRSRLGRGGSKRNRFSRKQNNDLTICKFFMQGKCQRGNDCPFSHTALPSKKMELCKFYMNDCCTKRDKCLYMHGDFPCKFYHTGQKCYAGKRCKFYHGKISNFLRSVLMKHLENRELQKEFDKYGEMFEKKDRDRGRDRGDRFSEKRRSRSDEEEGGSTPMPSPQRDEFASDSRERSPTPEREREKRERRRRRAKRRSREEEEKNREYYEDPEYYEDDNDHQRTVENEYDNWCGTVDQQYNYPEQNYNDNNDYANDDYPEEEDQDMNSLPANLPKAQRKLFMRIHQQQQPNKQCDDRPADNEGREDEFKEENWYSSDEENANNPLNTIFRNVPGLNQMQPPMNNPMQPPPLMTPALMSNLIHPNQIMNNPMQNNPMQNNPMQNNPMMNPPCPMNQSGMPMMPPMMPPPPPQSMGPMSNTMFDNIDLSAVSKILSTVRESIQKKNSSEPSGPAGSNSRPEPGPSESPKGNQQPVQEERRFRDPRLRGQDGNDRNKTSSSNNNNNNNPSNSKPSLSTPVLLTQADLDLRLSEPPPQLSMEAGSADVDLRHLPFKPAPLHQAAKEIDASISSGPPLEWKLSTLKPFRPDYTSIASRSNPQTCANDPRLRKYATPQVLAQSQMVVAQAMPSGQTKMMSSPPQGNRTSPPPQTHSNNPNNRNEEVVVSRDPRNRGGVANDPRRRNQPVANTTQQNTTQQQNTQQQPVFPSQPFSGMRPPQPFNQLLNPNMFDQHPPRQDNDFRLGILSQLPQLSSLPLPNISDIDLRIHQPHYYP